MKKARENIDWSNWKLEDFQECYNINFSVLSRNEVRKADQNFYDALCRYGFLDEVLP